MKLLHCTFLILLTLFVWTACTQTAEPTDDFGFELVASGFTQPLGLSHAGDDSGRLFVVEKGGLIHVLEDGSRLDQPFLDISDLVSTDSERGLLGLAFHPNYPEDERFFVSYTNMTGDSILASYRVSQDPNVAEASSGAQLLEVTQARRNHNGGHLAFGPDGYLYWGLGDGGGRGDPAGNAQDRSNLLGTLLRLDIDGGEPYAVPTDNPFTETEGRPEIWAYGLRNPWRFSFDRESGDLYIADVGQNAFEEVNVQPAGSAGGENYGWNTMEAEACFAPPDSCDQSGLALPVLAYAHSSGDGRSITGGYVYRGDALPDLEGGYVFGDFVSGRVWQARESAAWEKALLADTEYSIASFGEDEAGELYLIDFAGAVYRLVSSDGLKPSLSR